MTTTETRTKRDYTTKYQQMGDAIVQYCPIIGTNTVVLSVWVPSKLCGNHSTITTIRCGITESKKWYGRMGTERLPEDIDALPCGEGRFAAVKQYHEQLYADAYELIYQSHWGEIARKGHHWGGEIDIRVG